MKQKGTKILIALIAIILVIGTIMIFVKGLVFELEYQDSKRVEINLGKEYDEKEIKKITNEIFGNQPVKIQAIEVYKDALSIITTEITENQKAQLVASLNEKYETEIEDENVTIETIAHTRGRDIIKPYIIPFVVITIVVLGYLVIRYNKINSFKILTQSIGIIVLAQLVLLGIIVITRMPIGKFTIPTIIIVYLFSTYICTEKFEKDLEKVKINENKQK